MMKGKKYFMDALASVPQSTRKQVEYTMKVSDRLASVLQEKGMTQREFAKRMGKTEAEVSRWLGGTHNFTLSTLAKIACVLGEDIVTI